MSDQWQSSDAACKRGPPARLSVATADTERRCQIVQLTTQPSHFSTSWRQSCSSYRESTNLCILCPKIHKRQYYVAFFFWRRHRMLQLIPFIYGKDKARPITPTDAHRGSKGIARLFLYDYPDWGLWLPWLRFFRAFCIPKATNTHTQNME